MNDIISEAIYWFSQINWILSFIAALIISIAANLLTPRIKNKLAERSETAANKRIKELEQELLHIQKLYNNRNDLNMDSLRSIFKILLSFGLGGFAGSFLSLFGTIFYLIAVVEAQRQISLLEKISDFDTYKINTQAILDSLKSRRERKEN